MTHNADDKWTYGRRKDIIGDLSKCQHAGLWLDKYLYRQLIKGKSLSKNDLSPYKSLVNDVADIAEPEAYAHFFRRWQKHLTTMRISIDSYEYRVEARHATVQGRLAIGLGDESVIETAVTLHHTYGIPLIPGSALKGLAAAYAHQRLDDERWRKGGEYHKTLFGTTSEAGFVTFLDALYKPGSGHLYKESKDDVGIRRALWPDVITVHHPDYYTGSTPKPPADWDSPTPVPFLTATGTYLIVLGGPLAWVELAFKILKQALKDMGIGAKTSSGYGRMRFVECPVDSPDQSTAVDYSTGQEEIGEPNAEDNNPNAQPETISPELPVSPLPKRGQDLWGKVIDRRKGKWIVQLEAGGFEVVANDKQAKRRVDFDARVRVRIDTVEPLEGSIKDVVI